MSVLPGKWICYKMQCYAITSGQGRHHTCWCTWQHTHRLSRLQVAHEKKKKNMYCVNFVLDTNYCLIIYMGLLKYNAKWIKYNRFYAQFSGFVFINRCLSIVDGTVGVLKKLNKLGC